MIDPGLFANLPQTTLDPLWQAVDFVSDLHLAEDTPQTRATFDAYLTRTSADAIFLLGDIFEVWTGDDCLVDPQGPESGWVEMLAQVARRKHIGLLVGNRDFLFGEAACRAIGLHALADPGVLVAWGRRTLVTHGDAWCLDDLAYQRFRTEARSPAWQQAFLARPLPERRAIARQMRTVSEARKQETGPDGYADLDPQVIEQALLAADAQVLVHGHTHRPASHDLPAGRMRHVLSDWHCEPGTAPRRAEVLRWTAAGFQRLQVDESGQTVPC